MQFARKFAGLTQNQLSKNRQQKVRLGDTFVKREKRVFSQTYFHLKLKRKKLFTLSFPPLQLHSTALFKVTSRNENKLFNNALRNMHFIMASSIDAWMPARSCKQSEVILHYRISTGIFWLISKRLWTAVLTLEDFVPPKKRFRSRESFVIMSMTNFIYKKLFSMQVKALKRCIRK